MRHDPRRDWPEDAVHENGNYLNSCLACGETFIGLNRRAACRLCVTDSASHPAQGDACAAPDPDVS